jgi:general nucleoside transport system permease protein
LNLFLAILSLTMIAQTLRTTVPYACAALGGVWSERSGVVNIALEGLLLASGLASVVVDHATGNAWLGVLAGVAVGAFLAAAHALVVVYGGVDAIVSGIAINLAAAGGTRFVLRAIYDSSSNSPAIDAFRFKYFGGASGGMLLVRTLFDPLFAFAALATILTFWCLYMTPFGLRVRAGGEAPTAARALGIPVERMRVASVTIGGAICGLGGVALAYDQHQFQSGMSAGRGFIALAAVIVSGWRPVRAIIACALFAALDALQIVLQDRAGALRDVVQMLPYIVTILALALVVSRKGAGQPPAGLGKSAE